jgi:HD superfamily phosphohydrolase YqeK
LSAVEYHTTLREKPSQYDMALFIADKLSWDQEGQPPFYDVVAKALTKSLEAASLAYMTFIVENKMILYPHRWFSAGLAYLRMQE